MLATLAEPPLVSAGLVYEPKYDGIRALVDVRPGTARDGVRIWSRLGNEKTSQFPSIVRALERTARAAARPRCCSTARSSRSTRRAARPASSSCRAVSTSPTRATSRGIDKAQPVALIAFDLLRDGDEDVRGLPLTERRARLEQRASATPFSATLRISEQVAGDGRALRCAGAAQKAGRG